VSVQFSAQEQSS